MFFIQDAAFLFVILSTLAITMIMFTISFLRILQTICKQKLKNDYKNVNHVMHNKREKGIF